MKIKIMKRVEAEGRGLKMFYLGRKCKWGHDAVRLTRQGSNYWKEVLLSENAFAGACHECVRIMDENGGIIGQPFEDIMRDWDPAADNDDYKYLPVMSGTSKMGYKVVGKALIDTEWYEDCSKYLWVLDANGYTTMNLSKDNLARRGLTKPKGKTFNIKLHRYVSGVSNEVPLHVDHINGDTLDNTCKNLRLASTQDNSRNSTKNSGSSKFKGVCLREKYLKSKGLYVIYFQAQVTVEGKYHSKYFDCEVEAAKYYDNYIRENYPSEFNVYNFPREGENSVFR